MASARKSRNESKRPEKSVGTGPLTIELLDPVFHKEVEDTLAEIFVRLEKLEGNPSGATSAAAQLHPVLPDALPAVWHRQ